MTDTQQALAKAGLGNTSFAQDILSRERSSSADSIAKIGPSVASEFIGMTPGQTGQGIGALGTAAAFNNQSRFQQSGSYSGWNFDPGQFLSDLMFAYGEYKNPGGGGTY